MQVNLKNKKMVAQSFKLISIFFSSQINCYNYFINLCYFDHFLLKAKQQSVR